MRKSIRIALFISFLFLLGSCEREQRSSEKPFDGRISIIPNHVVTRAGFPETGVHRRFSLEDAGGASILVEEKLTSLGAPATRGAEVTTETVATAYPQMTVAAYTGETLIEEIKTFEYDGEGHWNGHYENNLWDNGAVDFFMLMGDGMTSLGKSGANFSFSYTSPSSAAAQQDILFSSRKQLTQDSYESEYNASVNNGFRGGATATFCHALTGVSFSLEQTEDAAITSITLKGLKNSGTCSYSAGSEEPDWSPGQMDSEFTGPSEEIFWLIPQTVSSMTLDITFNMNGKTLTMRDLPFGEYLGNVTLKAGELRNYTLRVKEPYDVILIIDSSNNTNAVSQPFSGTVQEVESNKYYLFNNYFYEVSLSGGGNAFYLSFVVNGEPYYIESTGSATTDRVPHTKKENITVNLYSVTTSRSAYVKESARNAITQLFNSTSIEGRPHRVALVSYHSSASVVQDFTELTSQSDVTSLQTAINGISNATSSVSRADLGLTAATNLIDSSRSSKKIILFITGSYPSNSSTVGYNSGVANAAINIAGNLSDVSVYSIWAGTTYSFLPIMDSFLNGIGETNTSSFFN